jgi:hypothetical protein
MITEPAKKIGHQDRPEAPGESIQIGNMFGFAQKTALPFTWVQIKTHEQSDPVTTGAIKAK